jgi:hypothetical protein
VNSSEALNAFSGSGTRLGWVNTAGKFAYGSESSIMSVRASGVLIPLRDFASPKALTASKPFTSSRR